mgnify:CR=1 FL=1
MEQLNDRQISIEETNRAAIQGWGPTLRLLALRIVPAILNPMTWIVIVSLLL